MTSRDINNLVKDGDKGIKELYKIHSRYFELVDQWSEKLTNGDLLNEFEKRGVKKVIFYGANDLSEIAFISLKATDIKLVGVVDDLKKGKKFLDFIIRSPVELKKIEFDRIIITSLESKDAIFDKLLQKKVPIEKIVMLE